MLTKKLEETRGALFDELALEQGRDLTTLARTAAVNSSDYHRARSQARRLRRQTRHSRLGAGSIGGWAIRSW